MAAKRKQPDRNVGGPTRPAGNGLAFERIGEIQRSRMLAAMVEVCAERGVSNVTVAHVVARSGVSRRTFYEQFASCEDCFLAAVDDAIARVCEHVLSSYRVPDSWRERIRAGLIALLSFLDNDPGAGRLLIVDTLGAGHNAQQRRGNVLAQVIAAVDAGRGDSKRGSEPPPLTAEGIVGGVLSVLHSRLVEGDGSMLALTGPLMSLIVLPYLGSAAARRELSLPVPKPAPPAPRANGDPLRDIEMRLTYRTLRVLLAVASHPGGSNRQVADSSGITDQGQISKLLRRLDGLGLIENTGVGLTRGAPNAWVLTERGWRVQSAIAEQSHGS